jgi:hypothetical protein
MGVMRCKLAQQHDDVTRDRHAHKKAMQGHRASNIWWDVDRLAVSMDERTATVLLCAVIGSVLRSELVVVLVLGTY